MASLSPKKITVFQQSAPSIARLAEAFRDCGVDVLYRDSPDISSNDLSDNNVVVVCIAAPQADQLRAVADMEFSDWMASADEPQFRLLAALQNLRSALNGRSCKVIILGPTIGLTGASGYAGLATASEGQRGLMKSLARQWAPQICFAWVSVWAPLLFPAIDEDALPEQCELGEYLPPLGERPKWSSVAKSILGFVGAIDAVTGQTIIVDGGEWMLP